MNEKRVAIKVYLSEDSEIYKRVLELSQKTTLSLSSVAGMALRHGLPSVETTMQKVFDGTEVLDHLPKRKKTSAKKK